LSVASAGLRAAVIAALLHTAAVLFDQHIIGGFRWFSREFIWMSFVAYSVVIMPVVFPLAVVAAISRERRWLALAAGIATAIALFGVLLPYTHVSRWASLVVALGSGVQVTYAATKYPVRWARRSRYVALAALFAAVSIAAIQQLVRNVSEIWAVRTLAKARAGAPNVLLVVLDAVRAKSFGVTNRAAATTPQLWRWAESSTVFDRAFSVAPWTLPSHASMFTGRYAGQLEADWTVPLDDAYPVLAERFKAAGYRTGGFNANLHYASYDSGLDRGFVHYDDYQIDWRQILASSSYAQTALFDRLRRRGSLREKLLAIVRADLSIVPQHRFHLRLADAVFDSYLRWQDRRSARPTFAFINVMDAHLVQSAALPERREYPPFERGESDYLSSIRFLDQQLDRLFKSLSQRGLLDRTIIIVTADHGELFGEHDLTGHARSMYKDVLHVPLMVRYPPDVPRGARIARAVSLRDLAATITSLAGIDRGEIPGVSLVNAWRDSAVALSPTLAEVRQLPNPQGDYPSAKGALKALATEDWFYIQNEGTGVEELYAYGADPEETVDYAQSGYFSDALLKPWRDWLARALAERRDPR
jgi:arylsulfatase A-like enzyme